MKAMNKGRWADLGPRTASAAILLGCGGAAIWVGGLVYTLFVSLCVGAIFWEILRMFDRALMLSALGLGALAFLCLCIAAYIPLWIAPLVLAVPLIFGLQQVFLRRREYARFATWILLGGFGLIWLRTSYGASWTTWLIFSVVATDVAGYFVGKYIGGAKLWPRISPNKTWSGTIGGWAAAAFTGFLVSIICPDMPSFLMWISVLVSMASQIGDIAQSALKRAVGVKDSSNLLPGHGGVFDRFDGMLGAGALCFLVAITWG